MLSKPRPVCPVPLLFSVIVKVDVLDTHVKVVGQLIIKLAVGGQKAEPVGVLNKYQTMNAALGHVYPFIMVNLALLLARV